MWILEVLKAFFESVTAVGKVVEKGLPSPEMSKQMYDDKRALELVKDRIKIENRIFNKIKNVPGADIESEVRSKTDLSEVETQEIITNIRARVEKYREKYPLISGWRRFNKKKDPT